jgi:hypothetical protein
MWKPDLKDYNKISSAAYKIIYEQAIQRFEECASESESITNKSITIFTSMIAVGVFFTGFSVTNKLHLSTLQLTLLLVAFMVDLIFLFRLMMPRAIYHRGIMPETLFPEKLDEDPLWEQESVVYYTAICIFQKKIEDFYLKLNKRIKLYKKAFVCSLLLLFSTIYFVVKTTFHL